MKLKRELSLLTVTLYGIGIILGAGIYVLIGQGAAIAGNAIWISFTVAALIAMFTGLSYAELSGMFPRTAAEYIYTKEAFKHPLLAFLVQWIMIFTMIISAATVALGFGGYLSALLPVTPIAAAAGLLVALSIINYIGIKESARFNVVATIVETSGLLLVICIGALFFGKTDIDYFAVPNGITSIISATGLIFFAYLGFEEMVNLSEETKNAKKIVPKALVIALIVSTILYILVSLSAVGVLGAEALASSKAPLADVVGKGIPQAGFLMYFIALFATANTVLAMLVVVSRMIYGMARQKVFPSVFGDVGSTKTPTAAIGIVMVLSLIALLIGGIKTIALLTDVGIFLVYIVINAAVIRLRYNEPKMKRTFRSPVNIGKFPLLALFGLATALILLSHFDLVLIGYEAIVIIVGIGCYYAMRKRKK